MQIIKSCGEMQKLATDLRTAGKTIGLVPTMGYLHEGHLSLMRKSREENNVSVISIYVNPTQFGRGEDFTTYPRDMEGDAQKAQNAGVDYIFAPGDKDMYPAGYCTFVEVEELTEGLCGASRPGHFKGVTTVVAKLFNICKPHRAYFGQKDAQQARILGQMTRDLNLDLEIVVMPIVREADGLALSSRNVYLSPEERKAAHSLSRSLKWAREVYRQGERSADLLIQGIIKMIEKEKTGTVDYVEIVDADTLKEVGQIERPALVALAVKYGKARLIDNCVLE
jgi:pantoate--beta-alanine ligase